MALIKWDFDTIHSHVGFTVRHLVVSKVRGSFNKWSGSLQFDGKNPLTASVEVKIDPASIDTNEAQRDAHLRSADFFDVEKFPEWTFKSTGVTKGSDETFKLAGNLTLHGVTKPVVLDVEFGGVMRDPYGNDRAGFTAKVTIDRKDFGVLWNQALDVGGVALGEKVEIAIDIEATTRPVEVTTSQTASP
jgi:polyisoprenoid-binding protein YceI